MRELLARADSYRRGRGDFSAHAGLLAALRARGAAPDALLFPAEKDKNFIPNAAELAFRGKHTVSPTFIEEALFRKDYAEAKRYGAPSCISCGCCSYVCPAKRFLAQSVKLAKKIIRERNI